MNINIKSTLALFFCQLLLVAEAIAFPVTEAKIQVEDVSECQINTASVEASIASVLRQNRIRIVTGSGPTFTLYFHATVNVLKEQTRCIVNVKTEVISYHLVTPPGGKSSGFAQVTWCDKASLLTGPQVDMPSRVYEKLRQFTELCINEVEKK